MMRAKVQEIVSWFDVSNYDQLLGFTTHQILEDIQFRLSFLYVGDNSDTLMNIQSMDESRLHFIDGLKKGRIESSSAYMCTLFDDNIELTEKPIDEDIKDLTFNCNGYNIVSCDFFNRDKTDSFTNGLSCTLFSVGDLISYHRSLSKQGFIIENDDGSIEVQGTYVHREITNIDYLGDYFNDELVIKFNLAEYSDNELITEFNEMIKKWRLESGIDEPDRVMSRVGLFTLKKLITYKVIPFIDLLIWEMAYKKKISNELYARILFPLFESDYDVMSSAQIKDTIKPFIDKIINDNFIREMIFFVKKNEYLKNMRFSDVLKLAEN